MKKIQQSTDIILYDHWSELTDVSAQELCQAAISAMTLSYSPYSQYPVGAALRLSDNQIITGNNQENAVYPLGQCAERVALYTAGSQHNKAVTALAVATKTTKEESAIPAFPCGSCRQVMLEFEERYDQDMIIYVVGGDGQVAEIQSAKELMPFAFNSSML